MTPDAALHAAVRITALVLWALVLYRTASLPPDHSDTQTRRWASTMLVLALVGAMVFGSLVNFGIVDIAMGRLVYTGAAAMVIVVAVAILSLRRE